MIVLIDELFFMHNHNKQVIAEMTNGGVDRSVECTGSIQAMISAFECVHDVNSSLFLIINLL